MGIREYAIIGLGIALLLALGALHIARADLGAVQAQYDGFKQTVEAQGKQAQAEAKLKETQNAQAINVAVTDRDTALSKLRDVQQAYSASRRMSLVPAAAQGSSSQCFSPAALTTAVEQYRAAVFGLVAEGDRAGIDAKALIQAWPK